MVNIPVNEDLLIRSYRSADAPHLFRAIDENRQHLRPWLPWVDLTTRESHSLDYIEDSILQLHNQEGVAVGIFYKDELIGGMGMLRWDHELRKAEVGYWISQKYEGNGIVSLCLEKFLDYLFSRIDLNKIEIRFIAANSRSASISNRFQAKVEGILRESILSNGSYQDLVITGILKREWVARKKASV
ncbi:MAG: N-acetyltransferase [Sphingobacteriales bacterium]|nr:MAG: N-acetyltransferase [Sphingobacteriales bacterium]